MAQRYRVIVIGCGAVGAATAYWLSRRLGGDGGNGGVLALEQYQHGHTRGASEDHSRVIRHAYSRPEYTALTPAAYQSWNVAVWNGTSWQATAAPKTPRPALVSSSSTGCPARRKPCASPTGSTARAASSSP